MYGYGTDDYYSAGYGAYQAMGNFMGAVEARFKRKDLDTLLAARVIRKPYDGLKVLGNGELKKKLNVKASKFSSAAKEKIEAAGGTTEEV